MCFEVSFQIGSRDDGYAYVILVAFAYVILVASAVILRAFGEVWVPDLTKYKHKITRNGDLRHLMVVFGEIWNPNLTK